MAKSRYLTIDVTPTILNVGADGQLTEDVRFNRPAKDNDTYTDDGIYIFSVDNLYTNTDPTTKTIYVGTDKYLLALSKNALTVNDLNEKIAQGATIEEDGTIIEYVPEPEPEPEVEPEPSVPEEPEPQPAAVEDIIPDNPTTEEPVADSTTPDVSEVSQSNPLVLPFIGLSIAGAIIIVYMVAKRSKRKM